MRVSLFAPQFKKRNLMALNATRHRAVPLVLTICDLLMFQPHRCTSLPASIDAILEPFVESAAWWRDRALHTGAASEQCVLIDTMAQPAVRGLRAECGHILYLLRGAAPGTQLHVGLQRVVAVYGELIGAGLAACGIAGVPHCCIGRHPAPAWA